MIDFFRSVSSRVHFGLLEKSVDSSILCGATDIFGEYAKISKNLSDKPQSSYTVDTDQDNGLLPSVIPIGAPWQQIHLLARKQKKVYIELFELTPVKLTFRLFLLCVYVSECHCEKTLSIYQWLSFAVVLLALHGSIGMKVSQTPAQASTTVLQFRWNNILHATSGDIMQNKMFFVSMVLLGRAS